MSEWKQIKLAPGSKLFKVHNFTFMHNGTNFNLEVDEYVDGSFSGHGEHSTDKNFVIESVSAKNLGDCLSALLKRVEGRRSTP